MTCEIPPLKADSLNFKIHASQEYGSEMLFLKYLNGGGNFFLKAVPRHNEHILNRIYSLYVTKKKGEDL